VIDPAARPEGVKMARKPNYDFERKERERLKDLKKAKRAAEKKEAQERKSGQSSEAGSDTPGTDTSE
jgi:hypothetical protein